MRCESALERMLEADPAELAVGNEALGGHLATCPRCRAVAVALTAELASLDAGLAALAAGDPVSAADAALAADRSTAAVRPLPQSRERRRPRLWLPLAAAAALALVLVVGREATPPGPGSMASPTRQVEPAVRSPRVAVTPPADRAAAILQTADPDITIVWLYEREGS